jgi:hypothetical protein
MATKGVLMLPTSVINHPQLTFKVYPNPIQNYIKIEFNETTKGQLIVRNSLGKKQMSQDFQNKTLKINTETFPPGVYIVQLIDDKGNTSFSKVFKN